MILDILISLPVLALLVWLFLISAPPGRSRGGIWRDRCFAVAAPAAALATITAGHTWGTADGMALNVMAVAGGYLVAVAVLGAGWGIRGLLSR